VLRTYKKRSGRRSKEKIGVESASLSFSPFCAQQLKDVKNQIKAPVFLHNSLPITGSFK
jgi:hypothetical protein